MKKNWAFFGSSLVSAYWNGAATYYRGIIHALAAKGHTITFYEPDAFDRQKNRDIQDPSWANVVVYPANASGLSQVLEQARGADIIVKASGVGVFDRELESEVLNLRGPQSLVLYWDVDAPATLHRVENDLEDPFRALIPRYDAIFTYGGGDPVVDRYRKLNARSCTPIYNALDPSTHYRVRPETRFQGALGFLGNRLPDREKRVEDFFLTPVARCPSERCLLGGSGWSDKPIPRNVSYLGHVYTHEHNAFNSSARAVLNLSRESMAENGFSPATRVFEAAGAGACIITDAWKGIELFLEPGREVLVAATGDEVLDHLRSLSETRARLIGEAAQKRITQQHTYWHRAEEVHQLIETGVA